MRATRVPWLSLAIALVIAFAGTIMVVSRANAAPVTAGDVALHQAAKKKIVNLAKNSKKLAGKPPSAYLDRVAFRSATNSIAVPAAVTTLLPGTNITVPGAVKFVRVTGNATFYGGGSNYILWFAMDQLCQASGVGYQNVQYGNASLQENSTIDFVVPVGPGVHTFRLCALGGASINAITRTLTLETVAKGPTGGNNLASSFPKAAPNRDSNPVTPR
ncbi:MAG TPA: hypothetical protein VNQ53_12280 [Nocardioides sp.]|nr:hypothetical protein [Nocardioides sp.]